MLSVRLNSVLLVFSTAVLNPFWEIENVSKPMLLVKYLLLVTTKKGELLNYQIAKYSEKIFGTIIVQ